MERLSEFVLSGVKILYTKDNVKDKNGYYEGLTYVKRESNLITIEQDKDINIVKYNLAICIDNNSDNEKEYFFKTLKCSYYNGKSWISFPVSTAYMHAVELNFDKQIKQIKIETTKKIFEPIILDIVYKFADKEAYYAEIEKKKAKEKAIEDEKLRKDLSLDVRDGVSLLNVSWHNVSKNITRTEIELYWQVGDNDFYDIRFPDPATSMSYNKKFINLRRVVLNKFDSDCNFAIIKDLAFGIYYIKVSQYSNNKLIIESNFLKYNLRSYPTNAYVKNAVSFSRD